MSSDQGSPPPGSGYGPSYPAGSGSSAPEHAQGNVLSIIAIVLGVVALLIAPIIIGVIGIILGVLATRRHERLAKWGLWVPIVGTVAGVVIALIVYNNQVA